MKISKQNIIRQPLRWAKGTRKGRIQQINSNIPPPNLSEKDVRTRKRLGPHTPQQEPRIDRQRVVEGLDTGSQYAG